MKSQSHASLFLERSEGRSPLTALTDINDILAAVGARVRPLDLRAAFAEVRALLAQPTLSQAEADAVRRGFLLSRAQLLEVIADAGRRPHVAGGGALETTAAPAGQHYPHLYVVAAGTDYSRFDRFHVNTADDGTGVDEIMQVLAGGPIRIHQWRRGGKTTTLSLACPDAETGWLVTYDGAVPHIGSVSAAHPGTKVLMQVIGPANWTLRYTDQSM
jgi:hypothetical protein